MDGAAAEAAGGFCSGGGDSGRSQTGFEKKQTKKPNNPAGSASACAHLLLGVDGAVFQGCVQGPLPLDVLQGGLPVGEEAHPLGATHVVAAERGGAVSQRWPVLPVGLKSLKHVREAAAIKIIFIGQHCCIYLPRCQSNQAPNALSS